MSSYSGSEFALRVALCDLIERLKRSEHKCVYLEQCRNEFAKEIMRLRAHNEYLSNINRHSISGQINTNYNHNHSNTNTNSNSGGISRLLTQFNVKAKKDNAIINNNNGIVADGDTDESWEEITVRLIKELRRDVAITTSSYGNYSNNALINDSSFGVSNSGAAVAAPYGGSDGEHRNAHNNYETHYSSSIDPNNVSIDDFNAKTVSRAMNQNKSAVSPNDGELNGVVNVFTNYNNNGCISQSDDEPKERVIVGNNKHENYEMKSGVTTKRTQNSKSMDQTECINAFCYAIYYVKKDLNEVLHALTQQNEKLNQLKAKHLRSYFQRQLNFEHSVHNNVMIASNSKLDQKSNDNY